MRAVADDIPEYNETFEVSVVLSNPLDTVSNPGVVQVVIVDDDGEVT